VGGLWEPDGERVMDLFPRFGSGGEIRAGKLSGAAAADAGDRARADDQSPNFLLMDEPTEGAGRLYWFARSPRH